MIKIERLIALVTGVGPGTGAAIARKLAEEDYVVVMIARDEQRLGALKSEIAHSHAYVCDVGDEAQLEATLSRIQAEVGSPSVVVHNAVAGVFGGFADIEPSVLLRNFKVNTVALLQLARRLTPAMIAAGEGALIVTGNTSALRGRAAFAGFAPTKAAQRILAEAIARDVGPKGIHVSYVVVDAAIDVRRARERHPGAPDDFFVDPNDIAAEILHLIRQPRSAWSFNVELRPFAETW